MAERIEPEFLAGLIERAATDVFEIMLRLPLVATGYRVQEEPSTAAHGLLSMIGVAGDWVGMGTFHCSPAMGCRIADAVFLTRHTVVDEEVLDTVAEMANIILGNVKTDFEPGRGNVLLSIPAVVEGRIFVKRSLSRRQWVVASFESDGEVIEIQIALSPNPNPTVPAAPTSHQMLGVPV